MESFVYDSLMADKTPMAVCVLCKDGRSGEIKEALSALDTMEFGKYRSAYTIDYRLSDILKTLLSPFKDDVIVFGASVETAEADCPTGGLLGTMGGECVSAEREIFSKDGFTFVTRPGEYAFALEGEDTSLAEEITGSVKNAQNMPEYMEDLTGISKDTEMLYDALEKSGREFIFISDGSGGRKGAAAVRGEIVLLYETKRRAKEETGLRGLKKIGIMGGTFDPIHNGHLIAAETARDRLGLDKVVFIPTGRTPYKKHSVTDGFRRYVMTCLAAGSNESFCVSSVEIDKSGFSYTADTVEEIRKRCDKDAKLYFITGADVLEDIAGWKNFDALSKICSFAAVTRPGYEAGEAVDRLLKRGVDIILVEGPALDISSSNIRQNTAEGRSVKYLMPEAVEKYISLHGLYKGAERGDERSWERLLKKLI